jgi:hypothetical protein
VNRNQKVILDKIALLDKQYVLTVKEALDLMEKPMNHKGFG